MTISDSNPLFCYRHTTIETTLRCNRCERPICTRCAIHTETGYRCPECVRGQQKIFDTARWYDFIFAIGLAIILSAMGSYLVNLIGFFALLASPFVGGAIAEAVRLVIHRRRNRSLFKLVGGAVFIGGLLPAITTILLTISLSSFGISSPLMAGTSLLSMLYPLIYAIIAASSCYYRLSGIHLR